MPCSDGTYCGNTAWAACSSGCSGSCSSRCGYACGYTCSGTCTGDCTRSCADDCTYSCSGSCHGSCSYYCASNCQSGCKYSCSGTCSAYCAYSCTANCTGGCKGSCSGTCTDACNNGCSGGNYTSVYLNLSFSTLIKAEEILDLKNMSINEASRRDKTTVDTVNEQINSEIFAKTMQDIKSNLTNAGTSSALASVSSNSTIYKNIVESYLEAAKDLYEVKIPAS